MHIKKSAGDEEAIAAHVSWRDIAEPTMKPGDEVGAGDRDAMSVGTTGSEVSVSSMSTLRKATFMERLLGKTRRSVS